MTTVKIISNPYNKQIDYKRKNVSTGDWVDIEDECPDSGLLKDELRHGFFPFYVDKIVDTIVDEYQDEKGQVDIVFEGTDDEYRELALVCGDEEHRQKIHLDKAGMYLENARDILPEIREIFNSLSPLISDIIRDQTGLQNELVKFSDAANDVIPICVVGNYSSGKSTFINALVGEEIMPSGDEPVTAKIYRITRMDYPNTARIAFDYDDEKVVIKFEEGAYRFVTGETDKELIRQLKEDLQQTSGKPVNVQVHSALNRINGFETSHPDESVSDLIEVSVPFTGGLWAQSHNQFVIFDTPGSNSASNEKHMEVLRKAMEDLSNGLPIFVSEYNTLDSTDNEKLIQQLKNMPELDSRFAMIVVNKADTASLPAEGFDQNNVNRLLNYAIPRSLFSEGIFFMSSIMGLGSKNKGVFIDEHNGEIFDDQQEKYCDPANKRYKQLYMYDIMPGKQKEHAVKDAHQNGDLLYINSGLYSVEHEIQIFANKYSSYNKCQQSYTFLGNIIEKASHEIEIDRGDRETFKKQCEENLEKDKKALLEEIEQQGNQLINNSMAQYHHAMQPVQKQIHDMYYQESLKDEHETLVNQQKLQFNVDEYEDNTEEAVGQTKEHLRQNINEITDSPNLQKLQTMFSRLAEDTKAAFAERKKLHDTQKKMDEEVDNQLIGHLNEDFRNYCKVAQELIKEASTQYWADSTSMAKKRITEIVTGSPALSEEKKDDLLKIIESYPGINIRDVVFVKIDFEYKLKIFNVVLLKTDKLNLESLRKEYNEQMSRQIQTIFAAVQENHESSVKKWMENLYATISENIVSYNPKLRDTQALINRETDRIIDLEEKSKKIQRYSDEIKRKMSWKQRI